MVLPELLYLFSIFEIGSSYVLLTVLGTHSIEQTGLEFTEISPVCVLSAGVKGVHHRIQLLTIVFA